MAMVEAAAQAVRRALEFEAGSYTASDLRVLEVRGEEAISRLYAIDVTVVVSEGAELEGLLGEEGLLTLACPDGGERLLHGLLSRVERWDTGGGPDRSRYVVRLVPRLWTLGLGRRSRIFQDLSIPELVKQVLDEGGVASRASLARRYPRREYCVQHQESDLDFVSRLLEEEGILYWFDHQRGGHTLVLADDPSAHLEVEGGARIPFRERSQMAADVEHVESFLFRREVRPTVVALHDRDWQRPALDLSARASANGAAIEVYEHPGRYADPGEGQVLSRVRLEEQRARAETASGTSDARQLAPGRTFELEDHPVAAFDGRYLVLSVRHQGWQPQILTDSNGAPEDGVERPLYRNEFACLRKAVPYRPERRTPRPVISGPQTAVVVGPADEEIHTDRHGRVKVQFHWDREGKRDDRSSCWIRVSQAWAGPGFGALYLPRVGHEVVVEFLEGDPDRPLVVGSVYNGENPPPIPLPAEKTRSTLRSASSPGSDGANELRFEDAKEAEEVYLHAQRNLSIEVENDKTQRVGGNETLTVEKDRSREVRGNQTLQVTKDDRSTIGATTTSSVPRWT